jgi:hypothetical protein
MTRALTLTAAIVLALLAGAWWLLPGGERRSAAIERLSAPAVSISETPSDMREVEMPAAVEDPLDPHDDGTARMEAAAQAEQIEDDALRVRVVDASGEPLDGVPTFLVTQDASGRRDEERHHQTTDTQGRARFADLRARIVAAPLLWSLGHDLPAEEPPSRVLDRAALATDELVAVLPPAGRIEVRVRELDGSPAPRGSEVRLRLAEHDEQDWKRTAVDGVARFPWVEPGHAWELAAWRPQGAAPARATVHGPALAGETVQVELVLGSDHPVVSFRAVDRAGLPLAIASLDLAHKQDFWFTMRTQLETDAAGRFLVDAANSPKGSPSILVSHRRADGSLLQGRATLPDAPAIGWNDGGDVVLDPEPLLCAGRVVDTTGRAVADAQVVAGSDQQGFRHFGNDEMQARGRSGPDGRFELRGLWESEDFDLGAEKGGERSEKIRARQGDEGLVLALEPRHTLTGCLAVDAGVDASAVSFQLLPDDGEPFGVDRQNDHSPFRFAFKEFTSEAVPESEPGCFRLQPVAGGTYTLRCTLEDVELARTQPFALQADLDLGTIDLRGRIHPCEIVLRGAADPEDLRGRATWRASGSPETHDVHFQGDRVRIQSPVLPIDVALLPEGYRVARLEGVREHAEVELEPALRVRIALWTEGELPAAPYSFGCSLYQDGLQVGEAQGPAFFEGAQRELVFLCAAAGKVEVRWQLQRSIDGASFGGAIGSGVLEDHAVAIEVREDPAEQFFTVQLDGAVLAELVSDPPW